MTATPDLVIYLAPGVGIAVLAVVSLWIRSKRRRGPNRSGNPPTE